MLRSQQTPASRRAEARRRAARRRTALLAAVIAVGAVIAAIMVASGGGSTASSGSSAPAASRPPSQSRSSAPPAAGIPAAKPGLAHVIMRGPNRPEIALTFDDGFCETCVARTIAFLARTGTHATIFPNGVYNASWGPQAATIRQLVSKGQLVVGNHTFLHHDPVAESSSAFQFDLRRNENWIERTFGITARPFFRPPYGAHNARTDSIAGQIGYTKVIIWSGTVADSSVRTVPYILNAIRHWASPGAIILMHGNYPATSAALPQIVDILKQRGLRPVTLKEMLG